MFHPRHRALTIEGAALLFNRAGVEGRQQAIEEATASIVAATVFLEQAIGRQRTVSILQETAAVLGSGPIINN